MPKLSKLTKITASQPGVQEGYTSDPEVAEVVKRLPGYLQPMVTLIATMVPPTEERRLQEKRGWEALTQATSMVLMVSILIHLNLHQVITDRLLNCLLLFSFLTGERQIEYSHLLKERLYEEEEMRKKAEEQLETKGAHAELMTAQTELAKLKEAFSTYQEDALMMVSRL